MHVNEAGTIVHVGGGAPTSLFAFQPEALLGKQLATVIDVFHEWERKGEWAQLLPWPVCCKACLPALPCVLCGQSDCTAVRCVVSLPALPIWPARLLCLYAVK